MRLRLLRTIEDHHRWDRLSASFWFIPLLMAIGAYLLAWALAWVDGRIPDEVLQNIGFILSGSTAELRTFLFSMATTVLATAGVVFTLLTLPLSTVAAQYGSRLLRIFLRDRVTQYVLGVFVATFVFCIEAALLAPQLDQQSGAPQVSASFGFLLFIATFASLILLIQHISTMLQAPSIAAAAGRELLTVVREASDANIRLEAGARPGESVPDLLAASAGRLVHVAASGYIMSVDLEPVLGVARERDLVIRLLRKPGHFVGAGTPVAMVWPAERVDTATERRIRRAFTVGRQRTPTQDVEYAVNQLAEMAVRAMSPAINDPYTAMTCLDYMGDGLAIYVRERRAWSTILDRDGSLRIVFDPVTIDQLLDAAFGMLRHAGSNNATVLLHMLDVIHEIGKAATEEGRRSLVRQIALIEAESRAGQLIEEDRRAIARRCAILEAEFCGQSGE